MTFTVYEGGNKKEGGRGEDTRNREEVRYKRIRPCVPPINREKKCSVFLGRNGKEPGYIRRYYGGRGEKRGGGGEGEARRRSPGGIARVGTPFLRDLYRGGGACKVART